MKKDCDEMIKALEDVLEACPDGAALRLYVGNKLDDAPMSPEEFIAFARDLLDVTREIRKQYE